MNFCNYIVMSVQSFQGLDFLISNEYVSVCFKPVRVAQLIGANVGRCGPSKRHMVLSSNPTTDNSLIYLVLVVASVIITKKKKKVY